MNDIIFNGKTLPDILENIHGNTSSRRYKILETIDMLKKLIKTVDDLVVVAPIIKDYYDVLVKSDDHDIKVATIIQRIQTAMALPGKGPSGDILSELEKADLLKSVSEAMSSLEAEVVDLDKKLIASKVELPLSGSGNA